MEKFGKAQPVKRVEDLRFLTGAGRYVDDTAPDGALRGFVLRSPVAHGRIAELDVSDAREMPGVHLVLTLADLEAAGRHVTMRATLVTNRDGSKGADPERPVLARDRVRFVGEPVAFIVAETMNEARDAAEAVMLDIEELPAHVTPVPGGETLHPEAPDNVAFDYGLGDEDGVAEAVARAAHVVRVRVEDNRVICNAMETRGAWAAPEGNERLHVSVNGQGVWGTKSDIARYFGWEPDRLHVTNPDVGGGFGMKAMTYPEYYLVAEAAHRLGRPVAWMSERTEAMLSDNAGRDLVSEVTLAFDADLRLLAYGVDTLANMGAYNSQYAQPIQTELFSKVLTGVYDVPRACMRCRGIYTNTTQVDAYRGAGRPEAIFTLERSMDAAARELGVDPWELRRRNFVPADAFPYRTPTGQTYDVGDFHRVLDRAGAEADRAGFAARRAASEARGRLRGQGLCYYIESILGDPVEHARVEFTEDGGIDLFVGTQSNGQGHETVYAAFLSDQTGVPADRIRVIQGDSDLIPAGGGTGGSRSVTLQNTATLKLVEEMLPKLAAFLAEEEGVPAAEVSFDDERFRLPGSNVAPTVLDVAERARQAGRDDLLVHRASIRMDKKSFPNGAHVAEVEIDPDTGVVTVDRYTVVDDLGVLINPMLAEGQVHGGVAQGAGQALTERVAYDEDGQLLTATFMDYGMPRADTLPMIAFHSEPTPCPTNPMGMKGCGEAGTVGALAAIANAVQDALWDRGVRSPQMPFTPLRVWQMLEEARAAA